MPRAARHAPSEIVAIGEALEAARGRPASASEIHRVLGGGRLDRVRAIWHGPLARRGAADFGEGVTAVGAPSAVIGTPVEPTGPATADDDPEDELSPLQLDEAAAEPLPF